MQIAETFLYCPETPTAGSTQAHVRDVPTTNHPKAAFLEALVANWRRFWHRFCHVISLEPTRLISDAFMTFITPAHNLRIFLFAFGLPTRSNNSNSEAQLAHHGRWSVPVNLTPQSKAFLGLHLLAGLHCAPIQPELDEYWLPMWANHVCAR